MGNTQQLDLRNKQRTVRFSRVFQPATVALLVSMGLSGCVSQGQVKAYEPPGAKKVVPAQTAAVPATSNTGVVVTDQHMENHSAVQVRADHPTEYVVVKGDTLWDISGKFLHDPFQWPSIWKQNPQIKNPHLIYPGDVIRLSVVDGRAVIDVLRPDGKGGYSSIAGGQVGAAPRMRNGREVLSPKVHEEELVRSVSNQAADAIRDFTKSPHVVTAEEMENAAYVLGTTDNRLASANGDNIYARGFSGKPQETYSVFRPSKPLIDPDTGEVLGFEAKRVADAELVRGGDPATLRLF
ncbi:MAG: LysM peptidoglycan-binding domain-containing protein, partial [Granulosicoccaceae bacterium]